MRWSVGIVFVALGLAACDNGGGDPSCLAGRQVECACPGGGAGVQICEEGSHWGPCTSCSDAGGDADAPDSNDLDGHLPDGDTPDGLVTDGDTPDDDADADLTSDADVTGPCVPPTNRDEAPTPGRCVSNKAIVCDPQAGVLVETRCGTDEECVIFPLIEPATKSTNNVERTIDWAACVPRGAQTCTYHWEPMPDHYTEGTWHSDFPARCTDDTGAIAMCDWPTIPRVGLHNIGSTVGFVYEYPCDLGEQCLDRENHSPHCYLSPLTECDDQPEYCDGDLAVICSMQPYLEINDCSQRNRTCAMDCNEYGIPQAGCRDRLPQGAVPCDPDTFEQTCADGQNISRCTDCREVDGQCTCYSYPESCDGCRPRTGEDCHCATSVHRETGDEHDFCYPISQPPCDPTTQPDRCDGDTVIQCFGVQRSYDCNNVGGVCEVVDGIGGCRDGADIECEPVETNHCEDGDVVGCCPDNGVFDPLNFGIPCTPRHQVRISCTESKPDSICISGECFAM